ncbi:MAG: flagellar hook assembly protein FlgD [Mariprofundaceae bacterium]
MQISTAQNIQTPQSNLSRQNLGSKDIFLKLLVAQMQNQDPLKPQDAVKMTSQLAQFNMVEQQISTNELLTAMLGSSQSINSDMANASAYLGHTVAADASSFNFDGTSPQDISIELPENAANVNVEIVDGSGNVVRTLHSGSLPAGVNNMTWDGVSDAGGTAAEGNYIIRVTATDANDAPVPAYTQIIGLVNAVRRTADGMVVLMLGTTPVSMDSITEIQS